MERTQPQSKIAYLLTQAKSRCKDSGLEFDIEPGDIEIPKVCPLLGIPFDFENRTYSLSLDRKDNSKGYVKGNVWVISYKANLMKSDASQEELQVFAENIFKHFGTGKLVGYGPEELL